jgi:uncharacterized RDD family membrane protein YckC
MDRIRITTPEHIELEYELAGLGARFVAVFVDHAIQGAITAVIVLVSVIVAILMYPDIDVGSFQKLMNSPVAIIAGIAIILTTIINLGYFIFFETIWSGQTPGKKIAQIQVVKDNGEPVRFIDALLRNIFRIVDWMIIYYYIGMALIWFRNDRKRVGDIVAQTIVVKLKSDLKPVVLPEIKIRYDLNLNITPLTEREYSLIRDFLIIRHQLKHETRTRISKKLAHLAGKKLGLDISNLDNEELLEIVAVEYRDFRKTI